MKPNDIIAMVNVPKDDGSSLVSLVTYKNATFWEGENGVTFYFGDDKKEFISYRFLISFRVSPSAPETPTNVKPLKGKKKA